MYGVYSALIIIICVIIIIGICFNFCINGGRRRQDLSNNGIPVSYAVEVENIPNNVQIYVIDLE